MLYRRYQLVNYECSLKIVNKRDKLRQAKRWYWLMMCWYNCIVLRIRSYWLSFHPVKQNNRIIFFLFVWVVTLKISIVLFACEMSTIFQFRCFPITYKKLWTAPAQYRQDWERAEGKLRGKIAWNIPCVNFNFEYNPSLSCCFLWLSRNVISTMYVLCEILRRIKFIATVVFCLCKVDDAVIIKGSFIKLFL